MGHFHVAEEHHVAFDILLGACEVAAQRLPIAQGGVFKQTFGVFGDAGAGAE